MALSARDADGINAAMRGLSAAEGERMSDEDCDAIAEFIRSKGITRCPTACVSPTQASVGAADRAVLEQHAATLIRRCKKKMQPPRSMAVSSIILYSSSSCF